MANRTCKDVLPMDTTVTQEDQPLIDRFMKDNGAAMEAWFVDCMEKSVVLPVNTPDEECEGDTLPLLVYSEVAWENMSAEDRNQFLDFQDRQYLQQSEMIKSMNKNAEDNLPGEIADYKDDLVKWAASEGNRPEGAVAPIEPTYDPMPEPAAPEMPEDNFTLRRITVNDQHVVAQIESLDLLNKGYEQGEINKIMLFTRHMSVQSANHYSKQRFAAEEAKAQAAALDMETLSPTPTEK